MNPNKRGMKSSKMNKGRNASKKVGNHCSKAVVLKVVDIDPQGSINRHMVEWGSLNGP